MSTDKTSRYDYYDIHSTIISTTTTNELYPPSYALIKPPMITPFTLVPATLTVDPTLRRPSLSRRLYDQLVSTAQDEDDRDVIEVDETTGLIGVCYEMEEPVEGSLWEVEARAGRARGRTTKEVVWARVFELSEDAERMIFKVPTLPRSWTHLPSSKRSSIEIKLTLLQPIPLDRIVLQTQSPRSSSPPEPNNPDPDHKEDEDQTTVDYLHEPDSKFTIFRQGETWDDDRTGRTFDILLTSPVLQGVVVQGMTEIIIVPRVSRGGEEEDGGQQGLDLDGEDSGLGGSITDISVRGGGGEGGVGLGGMSGSSVSGSKRGGRKADPFDPDNFLSASLFRDRDEEDDDDMDGEGDDDEDERAGRDERDIDDDDERTGNRDDRSIEEDFATPTILSASSGSLTPRPFGSPLQRYESLSSTSSATSNVPLDGIRSPTNPPRLASPEGAESDGFQGVPFEAVVLVRPPRSTRKHKGKSRQGSMMTAKAGEWPDGDSKCWLSMSGLAKAGVFVGDWVVLRLSKGSSEAQIRLAQVDVLPVDTDGDDDLPESPIFLSPMLHHRLVGSTVGTSTTSRHNIMLLPIPSGHRIPSLPIAKYITLSRIASPVSVDKRYEERFTTGLRRHFEQDDKENKRLIKQGDVIAVPVVNDRVGQDEGEEPTHIAVVYFAVSYMSYDPLLPLEEDFVMSPSSQARAGEFGCWIDVERTRMMTISVQHGRSIPGMDTWYRIKQEPKAFSDKLALRLKNFISAHLSTSSFMSFNIPLLLTGARGAGKASLIRRVAAELGVHVVEVDCYEILDEAPATTEGTLLARLEKAQSCAPCILLLRHVEALGRKEASQKRGKDSPPLVKLIAAMQAKVSAPDLPTMLAGTTSEPDQMSEDNMNVFKQELKLDAPSEPERTAILETLVGDMNLSVDVDLKRIARETAALTAIDLSNLADRAQMAAMKRLTGLKEHASSAVHVGLPIANGDFEQALTKARTSLADAIGAPKIPNVSWDDVGGLAEVKSDILDTIQLPLERPELFAEGLKKRSGILLYGPPGTGKTLLAKAVATSCSLNFFSVKGPELLNMYIGESEANVRRVFQKARDAQPCVIFMDELDSIAPKRGNQGDSGGVMDRIVSQLLAELDGMAEGKAGAGVFVMAATNRPDLLDPALLRPGRFDRMLYLSVSTDHKTQHNILSALTRKFNLDPDLDLMAVAERCPFNYTGADFYALCSDAMLKAMSRTASEVDKRITLLESTPEPRAFPKPLTPQYYLSAMAKPEETEVLVTEKDFIGALEELIPSVSLDDIQHYESVRRKFASETLNSESKVNGDVNGDIKKKDKGKGKARA